jgi:DNA-3-methyladenine glycosylase
MQGRIDRVTFAELAESNPLTAAGRLLGATLTVEDVAVRIVEVAYGSDPDGPWPDPAAHSFRGPTARNAVLFGPGGSLYVDRSYGIHTCLNVTCGPDGVAGAVLIRSGEVILGEDAASARRPAARRPHDLARGPGNLASALGITLGSYGSQLFDPGSRVGLRLAPAATGPAVRASE